MDKNELIFIRELIPDVRAELKYATADNFTGRVIYGFTDPRLRRGTAERLAAAEAALRGKGLRLLIWDAYRPHPAQLRLWQAVPDARYVANPLTGFSAHTRGSAVDVTLLTLAGAPVAMPSGFDDFSPRARRDYTLATAEEQANSRLLEAVMTAAGFRPYFEEWWHYTDTDDYPPVTEQQ